MTEPGWTVCPRCGVLVDHREKHERWHKELKGTSDPDKDTPYIRRIIALD